MQGNALMILEFAIGGPAIHHRAKARSFIIIQRTDVLRGDVGHNRGLSTDL